MEAVRKFESFRERVKTQRTTAYSRERRETARKSLKKYCEEMKPEEELEAGDENNEC